MAMEPSGYFQAGENQLYATLHRPAQGSAKATVLFCPPFGEERKCAYRLLVRLARALAAEGYAVVRFDYSGTGESTGCHGTATLAGWLADAGVALDVARKQFGAGPWIAFGARLGSAIAVRLAAQRNAAGLLLLEPILTGTDYLRDLLRRQRIKDMMGGRESGGRGDDAAKTWESGAAVNLGGYEVGGELATELEHFDLLRDLQATPDDCPVQLLRVSGGKTFPQGWKPAVEFIRQRPRSSAGIVRDKPFWGQLEYYESDAVPAAVHDLLERDLLGDVPADAAESAPELAPEIAAETAGREQAVQFAVEEAQLKGNLLIPGKHGDTGAVFVHGYSGNRTGPHGLVTSMARRLGQAGIPSLRFDLRGRGESEGNGLAATLPTMAADLVGATGFLTARCGVRKVVLVGICSGGNVAIGTLPRIPAAAGLVLLSVYPFSDGDSFGRDVNRTLHFARQYWHKALRTETWKRLFRGDIHLLQVLNVLFGHFVRKRGAQQQPAERKPAQTDSEQHEPKSPPTKHLANLRSGLPAVMLYGTADPDAKPARTYYEGYAREHGLPIEFVEIEGANHNFSAPDWKAEVASRAADFCTKLA